MCGVRLRDGRELGAANFVCAVPSRRCSRLLPESPRRIRFSRRLRTCKARRSSAFTHGSIATLPIPPFVGFIGSTTQWLFNKRRIFAQRGERQPGYLSFVISGARNLVDRSNEELLDIVLDDLHG